MKLKRRALWLTAGGLGLVIAWRLLPRCDNDRLGRELAVAEALARTTTGLSDARRHALNAVDEACPGRPDWAAYDLQSTGWQIDAVIRHRTRSRFETWLLCETDEFVWWWETPKSVEKCGFDRLSPFEADELEQLRGTYGFGFWAAVAQLEREGMDPALLDRLVRILILSGDASRGSDLVVSPGRVEAPGEQLSASLDDPAAFQPIFELFIEDRSFGDDWFVSIHADTPARDLAWLRRHRNYPPPGADRWTLEQREALAMPVHAEVWLPVGPSEIAPSVIEESVVLRIDADGCRLDDGTLRACEEVVERVGVARAIVTIAGGVPAAVFMPVLARLWDKGRKRGSTVFPIAVLFD